ncbi:hypothetical protein [Dactylosporangium salmoneum]|uniref:Uncharacterized protein n=1 Tax=Dactylosporangium salmoneum TaxID=53361 RepID=A0ABP5SCX1_9ACTN
MSEWGMFGLGLVASLAVNEMCDISPWLAARLIPVAVRLWTKDPERREVYNEDWQAVVSQHPGKLLKLGAALWFLAGGAARAALASPLRRIAAFYLYGLRITMAGPRTPMVLLSISLGASVFAGTYKAFTTSGVFEVAAVCLPVAVPMLTPFFVAWGAYDGRRAAEREIRARKDH